MQQINPNQIVVPNPKAPNPVSGLPRDLQPDPFAALIYEANLNKTQIDDVVSLEDELDVPVSESSGYETPTVLSIKTQSVNIKPDGTAAIDVVITVSDIEGVDEYDVRIAKNVGNL